MAYLEQSKRPGAGTLKSILDRTKESKSVSPYKDKAIEPIKVEQAPTPQPEPILEPAEVSPTQDVIADNTDQQGPGTPKKPTQTAEKSMRPSTYEMNVKPDFTKPYKMPSMTSGNKMVGELIESAVDYTVNQKYSGKFIPSKSKEDYKLDLLSGVRNGDYVISPEGGVVTKPVGKFQSAVKSYFDFFDNKSIGISYYKGDEKTKQDILEQEFVKSLKAVPQGESSTVGSVLGGLGAGITTIAAASATAGLLAATTIESGGTASPYTIPALSATLNGLYMTFGTGFESEKETYIRARNNGADKGQAAVIAARGRGTYLTTSFAENAALQLAGGNISKSLNVAQKAAGNSLQKYLTQSALYNVPEAAASSGTVGLMEYARAKEIESATGDTDIDPVGRGVEAFKYSALLMGSIKVLSTTVGATKIAGGNALKARALNMAATADREFVNSRLTEMKQAGEINQTTYDQILKEIDDFNKLRKDNPQISDDKAPAVVGLMLKKKKMQKAFNSMDSKDPMKADALSVIDEINLRIKKALSSDDELAGENDPLTNGTLISQEEAAQISKNATTKLQGKVQEGDANGRVGQYQGTESEQAQAANEADNSYRALGIKEEVVTPKLFEQGDANAVFAKMTNAATEQLGRNADDTRGATQKAIKLLKNSDFYKKLNPNDREQYIVAAMKHFGDPPVKGLGAKQTLDKILGNVTEKITVTQASILKQMIKAQMSTADGIKATRQQISDGIAALDKKRGSVKSREFKGLLKKYDKLDITNNDKVNAFVEHISNVINKADYEAELNQANSIKKGIAKLSNREGLDIGLSKAAQEFMKINPEQVDDLGAYIAKANEVFEGIRRPKTILKGQGKSFAQPFVIEDAYDYISKQTEIIQAKNKQNMLDDFSDLADQGIISKDMEFSEMEAIIKGIEEPVKDAPVPSAQKTNNIRAFLDKRFSSLYSVANSILEKGEDGFGNKVVVKISPEDRAILSSVMKAGIKNMKLTDAYRVIEGLGNFATNGDHSGLQKPLYSYYGDMQAEFNRQAPIKAITQPGKGSTFYTNTFGSLPLYMSKLFGVKDVEFGKMSGMNDFKNSISQSHTRIDAIENEFKTLFGKKKPNGMAINSQDNIHEMALFSHMYRNAGGSIDDMADEFNIRKSLLDDSINEMTSSSDKDISKLGRAYRKTYDKVLKESNSIDDLTTKMDKINVEAVNFWVGKWSELYPEMQSHAKNFYNKELGRQNNFTPDVFRNKGASKININEDSFEEGFIPSAADMIFKKESGRFMPSNIQPKVAEGKYLSLDFLADQKGTMRSTFIDINSSKYVAQMDAFIKSNGIKSSFDNELNADNVTKRFKKYVNSARGKSSYDSDIINETSFFKTASTLAGLASSATLSGFRGAAQQLSPLSKSFMETGRLGVKEVTTNSNVKRLIDNSGRDIANSTLEGQLSLTAIDRFMKSSTADANAVSGFFKDAAAYWGKQTLGRGDALARRAAFWSYYTKYLDDNGTDVSKVDWSKVEKLDDMAADWAQAQVDKKQNVVQTDLKGTMMSSKDPKTGLLKNAVMPLSDFMMNQKISFFNNVNKSLKWSSSLENRLDGASNAFGTVMETIVFNSIKGGIGSLYQGASDAINGHTPSEIEKQRRDKRRSDMSNRNIVSDLISPIPFLNSVTEATVGSIIDSYYDNFTDIPKQLRPELGGTKNIYPGQEAGLVGISAGAFIKGADMLETAYSEKVEKDINGQAKEFSIIPEDKGRSAMYGGIMALQATGLLPADFKSIATEGYNTIKNRALTDKQKKDYDLIMEAGSKLTEFKKIDGKNIFQEIPGILTQNDPLAKAEYLKTLMEKFGIEEVIQMNRIIEKYNEPRSVGAKLNIISNKDIFALRGITSNNKNLEDVSKAILYNDDDVVTYNLFKKRQDMANSPTEFYDYIAEGIVTKAITKKMLLSYGVYLAEKEKELKSKGADFSIDFQILNELARKAGFQFKEGEQ